MSERVYLVSCVGLKAAAPCPAKDLYISPWFRKARALVEARGASWWILSAALGVVEPGEVAAPYEATLNTMPARERRAWAARVVPALLRVLPPGAVVIILAGTRYREHLVEPLEREGFVVEVPMRGMGIGYQLQHLTRALAS